MSLGDQETAGRDPVEELAEEYVQGLRSGNTTDIEAYTLRLPQHADRIRELFPLLAALEGMRGSGEAQAAPPSSIGDYAIVREIGRGGMGVVYEAEQPTLNRRVALKVLSPLAAGDPDHRRRLRDEALALAQLEHANIVPIYDVGDWEGQPFFSMQLIRGSSLAERLKQGPRPQREAAELLLPVCRAIEAAHRRGVVHRDLKPSNILLDVDGRPLVADFGLARFVSRDQQTRTGTVAGTPSYMSPEQARETSRVGPQSDIYSLGAVLYEMMTGRPPFQASSPVETMMMVLEEDPLPPRALNSRLGRDLEAVVMKCLAKSPDDRYASAAELAADLQAYLNDEPVSARRFLWSDLWAATKRETRFVAVMYNLAWEWMFLAFHGLAVFLTFAALKWAGVENHLYYYGVWGGSIPPMVVVLKALRRRFSWDSLIQRIITYLATALGIVCVLTLVMEGTLRLPVLVLSPIFAIVFFAQFLVKAQLLSGIFYIPAGAYFLCTFAMMVLVRYNRPDLSILLLAIVHWAAFFFSGLTFLLRGRRARPAERMRPA